MELSEQIARIHRELDELNAAVVRDSDGRLRMLQQAARSLRHAESTAQWVRILEAAAGPLASKSVFVRIENGAAERDGIRLELSSAPAIRQAVETRETVVCVSTPTQLSTPIAELWDGKRAHLFPLNGRSRVLGVLVAFGDNGIDNHAIEVLIALAASSLELRDSKGAGTGLISGPTVKAVAPGPAAPPSNDLDNAAQWFAAKTVAGWIESQSSKIAIGRAQRDLYGALQLAIDSSRSTYRRRFLGANRASADFLHREVLTMLASGDESLLGQRYPGPLAADS